MERAARIRQPVAADFAQRLDHVGHLVGKAGLDLAFLARLQICRERLAAFLDHAGKVLGELLDIHGTSFAFIRRGHVAAFTLRVGRSSPHSRRGGGRDR